MFDIDPLWPGLVVSIVVFIGISVFRGIGLRSEHTDSKEKI